MFVFRKIWRALFSWNTRFEVRPFALFSTFYNLSKNPRRIAAFFPTNLGSDSDSEQGQVLSNCHYTEMGALNQVLTLQLTYLVFLEHPFWGSAEPDVCSCDFQLSSHSWRSLLKLLNWIKPPQRYKVNFIEGYYYRKIAFLIVLKKTLSKFCSAWSSYWIDFS